MPRWMSQIFPPDPPLNPMVFSRRPVVHRFWLGGMMAATVGFGLGFLLWSWQQGILPADVLYPQARLWHARIQIVWFLGSFLLGFALQSGPHVVGGTPPAARSVLRLLLLLQVGFVLSLFDGWLEVVGNGLVSMAYLGAVHVLWHIARTGDPARRLSRGIPLTVSFLPMAVAPWLALDNAGLALWVLWCGPVTTSLVAGQQLIQNVLGGTFLQGSVGRLFAGSLLVAWILSTLASLGVVSSWQWAAGAWLAVLLFLAGGTQFPQAVRRSGFSAMTVTLTVGFTIAFASALWLAWPGESNPPLDGAVHLLGAGTLTLFILGVAARVAGFFSGVMVLNDRLLCYLLLLWAMVALARVGTALAWHPGRMGLIALMLTGSTLLLLWSVRMAVCLRRISRKITPELLDR
ncbi:MAG: NnrS family protein [Magnetococcus sp. MYC-9]